MTHKYTTEFLETQIDGILTEIDKDKLVLACQTNKPGWNAGTEVAVFVAHDTEPWHLLASLGTVVTILVDLVKDDVDTDNMMDALRRTVEYLIKTRGR